MRAPKPQCPKCNEETRLVPGTGDHAGTRSTHFEHGYYICSCCNIKFFVESSGGFSKGEGWVWENRIDHIIPLIAKDAL